MQHELALWTNSRRAFFANLLGKCFFLTGGARLLSVTGKAICFETLRPFAGNSLDLAGGTAQPAQIAEGYSALWNRGWGVWIASGNHTDI